MTPVHCMNLNIWWASQSNYIIQNLNYENNNCLDWQRQQSVIEILSVLLETREWPYIVRSVIQEFRGRTWCSIHQHPPQFVTLQSRLTGAVELGDHIQKQITGLPELIGQFCVLCFLSLSAFFHMATGKKSKFWKSILLWNTSNRSQANRWS